MRPHLHKAPPYVAPTARIVRDPRDASRDYFIPLLTAWKLERAGKLVALDMGDSYRNAYTLKKDTTCND